jgi:hypothetical protein
MLIASLAAQGGEQVIVVEASQGGDGAGVGAGGGGAFAYGLNRLLDGIENPSR